MASQAGPASPAPPAPLAAARHYFRFHEPHRHLASPFGPGWFGERAEGFARFFGTPQFLIGQTLVVGVWIFVNSMHWTRFDLYPFILLNLAFSLQAAYAAPLILLAQTRQAERDNMHADADARHREELARDALERQEAAARQAAQLRELLEQNTALTEQVQQLARQIDGLTRQIHGRVCGE